MLIHRREGKQERTCLGLLAPPPALPLEHLAGAPADVLVTLPSSLPARRSTHDLLSTSPAIEAAASKMRGFYMQYLDSKWQSHSIDTLKIPIGTSRARSHGSCRPVVAGLGISDPWNRDASVLSQIPCDTRQRKYLCNTPFLLLSCASVAPHMRSDMQAQPGAWDRICSIAFAYRSWACGKLCTISSTVSVIGQAWWVFCMVGSACRLPPAMRPRRIPPWLVVCMQYCVADVGSAWGRRRMGWLGPSGQRQPHPVAFSLSPSEPAFNGSL